MIPGFEDSLKNAIPPASPASAGGQPLAIAFPGVGRPSADLSAVRDGRRSVPLGYLVDLSVARSIAAGTALTVPLQGNTFLADPLYDLTGVAQAGIARVHFEGENVTPFDTYVTVLPGAIYRVPFTKVTVENYAQAGKFLYIVYGVDLDLVPGQLQINDVSDRASRLLGIVQIASNGSAVVEAINNPAGLSAGNNALVTRDVGFAYATSFISSTGLTANTPENVIAAASNLNGYLLWDGQIFSGNGTAVTLAAMTAKATAPANSSDGEVLSLSAGAVAFTSTFATWVRLQRGVFVSSGKRLDSITSVTETSAHRQYKYNLF